MKEYSKLVKEVAVNLSNYLYQNNLQATKELIELFDAILAYPLYSAKDYVKMYDANYFTYLTWEDLVISENYYDGLSEEELKQEIGVSIWNLPCGWYVQCV